MRTHTEWKIVNIQSRIAKYAARIFNSMMWWSSSNIFLNACFSKGKIVIILHTFMKYVHILQYIGFKSIIVSIYAYVGGYMNVMCDRPQCHV